nr:HNH endonuclease [Sphingomonas laterariae]
MCLPKGVTRLAAVVDHIKPLAHGGSDEDSNTRNLCDSCHAEVTAEQFGHRGPIKGRGVSRSGRPTNPDHPWNAPPGGGESGGPSVRDTERSLRAHREQFQT